MKDKNCIKCNLIKPLSSFYKNKKMNDGHINKCKECSKTEMRNRHSKLMMNPEYAEKEKLRSREKYYRLNYNERFRKSTEHNKKQRENYKMKYPEKLRAKARSGHMVVPSGLVKHHWNYSEGFEKDIIFISNENHNKLHRHTIYDQERMMYRDLNGELIDTRERCEELIEKIKI